MPSKTIASIPATSAIVAAGAELDTSSFFASGAAVDGATTRAVAVAAGASVLRSARAVGEGASPAVSRPPTMNQYNEQTTHNTPFP